MNLTEAKEAIKEPNGAPLGRLVMAMGKLCMRENDAHISLQELVKCLERDHKLGRMTPVSEYAALALYRRTGRKRRDGHALYEDFITDPNDWAAYLAQHGFTPAS